MSCQISKFRLLVGPQSRSALFGDEERFWSAAGIELRPVGHLSRNLITTSSELSMTLILYRGADKSLIRPGRKQATPTKLIFCKPLKKKKNQKVVRSNDPRVGRKMATFQLFFQSGRAKDSSAPVYLLYTRLVSQSCSWHPCLLFLRLGVQELLRTPTAVTRYVWF